jgi:uncharacterized delta-60 repeat protein
MRSNFPHFIAIMILGASAAFSSTLDTSFGAGGTVVTSVGSGNDLAQAVAVYPDGRVLAAGYAFNGINNDLAVVRYMPNGSLDPTFGQVGMIMVPIGTSEDEAFSCFIQPDGKIVVAGQTYDGIKTSFAAIRLNPDGTLDQSFNGTGKIVITPSVGNALVRSVVVQPDGKTVLAGVGSNGLNFDIILARLNADGTLDEGFAAAGLLVKTVGPAHDQAYGVAIQADGKIVVGGYYNTPSSADTVVLRFLANGDPDPGFGVNGVAIHSFSSDVDEALAMSLAPDGRIVLAGCIRTGAPNDFMVARLMPNGSADTSFGVGGLAIVPFSSGTDIGFGVAAQTDGKVVAVGFGSNGSNNDFAVVRLNADGTPDETFGDGGKALTMIGPSADVANAVAIAPDGTIVAAGRTVSTTADFGVVRYRAGVAAITGRVVTPSGIPLRDTRVSLIDAGGSVRIATTSSFGIFRFENIPTADGYTIAARSKRYRFAPSPINLAGNLTGIEIVGLE